MSYKVICALGDSITNGYWDEEGQGGWFGRLQRLIVPAYPYKFGFDNLAKDGDRSIDVLHRLQSEAVSRKPDYLIIAVGTNDIMCWDRPDGPSDMSADFREEVWQKILSHAQTVTRNVLVTGLLPVVENRLPGIGDFGRQYYQSNQGIAAYNAFIKGRCFRRSIEFADYTEHFTAENFYDAVHPNAAGHQRLAELTFARMKTIGWLA